MDLEKSPILIKLLEVPTVPPSEKNWSKNTQLGIVHYDKAYMANLLKNQLS